MDRDKSLIDQIYTVLSRVHEEEISWSFGDWIRNGSAKLTVASDSVFFSISFAEFAAHGPKYDSAWACLAAIESVYALQRYLLKRGVLTRGGLCIGPLLHDDHVIFGPGLVAAYRLESQLALYPRVIVDPAAFERIATARDEEHFLFRHRVEALTRRDRDGLIFIDYLNYNAMSIENTPLLAELFQAIRNNIQNALDASRQDPRVFQKVAWLASYFNESLARWLSDPELAEQRSAFNQIEPIELDLVWCRPTSR
jgi:hypothetical protein